MAAQRTDPFAYFRFRVEIEGITQAGFTECTGLGSIVEVVDYREGGEGTPVRKIPGRVTHPDIAFAMG